MTENNQKDKVCEVCGGRQWLGQWGIVRVYMFGGWSCWVAVVLMAVGLVLGLGWSRYGFVLVVVGYMMPLVNADLRLLLYPYVAMMSLCGKKVNCPKCEASGDIFSGK